MATKTYEPEVTLSEHHNVRPERHQQTYRIVTVRRVLGNTYRIAVELDTSVPSQCVTKVDALAAGAGFTMLLSLEDGQMALAKEYYALSHVDRGRADVLRMLREYTAVLLTEACLIWTGS